MEASWSWPTYALTADAVAAGWDNGETVDLKIGAGATLWIGRRTVELSHPQKYVAFVQDLDGLQAPLRRLVRAVATELSSKRAIYLPDSGYKVSSVMDLVHEDVPFDTVCEHLQRDFGPPATTIAGIYSETTDGYNVDGYYIEELGA